MSQVRKCEMPGCNDVTLVKMHHESTHTVEKYRCPNPECGRMYSISTPVGKAAQLGALGTFGLLGVSLLKLDWDGMLEHEKDTLDNLLG